MQNKKTQIQNQIKELQAQLALLVEQDKSKFEKYFGETNAANFVMNNEHPQYEAMKNILMDNASKGGKKYIESAEMGELIINAFAKKKLGNVELFIKGTKWPQDIQKGFDIDILDGCEMLQYNIKEFVFIQDRDTKPEPEKVEDLGFNTNILDIAPTQEVEVKNEAPSADANVEEWNDFLEQEGLTDGKYASLEDAFKDLESDLQGLK